MFYFLKLIRHLTFENVGVLFTYGITGSGKTYTMMGPLNNPGLIPRSFDVLFNSVGSYLGKKYVSLIRVHFFIDQIV
jgi:kinesin family protein 23